MLKAYSLVYHTSNIPVSNTFLWWSSVSVAFNVIIKHPFFVPSYQTMKILRFFVLSNKEVQIDKRCARLFAVKVCGTHRPALHFLPNDLRCSNIVEFEQSNIIANSSVVTRGFSSTTSNKSSLLTSWGLPVLGLSSRLKSPTLNRLNHRWQVRDVNVWDKLYWFRVLPLLRCHVPETNKALKIEVVFVFFVGKKTNKK